MLTMILLIYSIGALGTYVWMHESWDIEDLVMPEATWLPFMWPIIALCYVWERILND